MKRVLAVLATALVLVTCRDATSPHTVGLQPVRVSAQSSLDGPSVATDRADYMPGDTVVVTGAGWLPGETVVLVLVEDPVVHEPDTALVVADSTGAIVSRDFLIDIHDFGQSFTLTASGLTSELSAETSFRDGHSIYYVSPSFGPTSGGTWVTIAGNFPPSVCYTWWGCYNFGYSAFYREANGSITFLQIVVSTPSSITFIAHAHSAVTLGVGVRACLYAWWNPPCEDVVRGTYTYVASLNRPPVANAGTNYAANEGSAVAFNGTGSSDPDGNTLTYDWIFGDGSSAPNAGPTPNHTYADNGTYSASLTVRDPGGLSATATASVNVANVAPSVSVIAGAEILQGETYSASGSFTDPGWADTYTGSVNWGDGSTASLGLSGKNFTLSHAYTRAGEFTVTVRITDDDGGTGAASAEIKVINTPPIAVAGGPYAGNEGSSITLNASGSSDREHDPLTFDWDFGDGTRAANSGPTPLHTYADNGNFTATVTVRDDHGNSSTATATVTVANVAPSLSAIAGAEILRGETYSAGGSFADPGADSHAASVNWGDGSTASLALSGNTFNLSHTYTSAGTFTVTVTVTDDDGGIGSRSTSVTVLTPAQGAQALGTKIQSMVTDGLVPSTSATPFLSSMDAAAASLANGNVNAGRGQLGAFSNKVDAAVKTGKISAAVGAELTAFAQRVLDSMGG